MCFTTLDVQKVFTVTSRLLCWECRAFPQHPVYGAQEVSSQRKSKYKKEWMPSDQNISKNYSVCLSPFHPPFPLSSQQKDLKVASMSQLLLVKVWGSVFWHFLPCDNELCPKSPCNLSCAWIPIISLHTYICFVLWAELCPPTPNSYVEALTLYIWLWLYLEIRLFFFFLNIFIEV